MDLAALTPVETLAIIGVVLGFCGFLLGVFALVRISYLRRSLVLLAATDGRDTFVDIVARVVKENRELAKDLDEIDRVLTKTRHELSDALRHVSVVRYDAFGDLGGRYSFSAALLDDSGAGLVLTSIHGRSETRTYLKGLSSGKSDIELSPEENKAVALARGDKK